MGQTIELMDSVAVLGKELVGGRKTEMDLVAGHIWSWWEAKRRRWNRLLCHMRSQWGDHARKQWVHGGIVPRMWLYQECG